MVEPVEFTEAERIEVARRTSEMNSIIKLSARVFAQEEVTQEQIIETKRATENYWLWGVGFLGLVIDSFLREATFDFNFGSFIWITVAMALIAYNFKLFQLENELKRIRDRLYDLDRMWFAAIGADTFWQTKPYFEDLSFFDHELMCDGATTHRRQQLEQILMTVTK